MKLIAMYIQTDCILKGQTVLFDPRYRLEEKEGLKVPEKKELDDFPISAEENFWRFETEKTSNHVTNVNLIIGNNAAGKTLLLYLIIRMLDQLRRKREPPNNDQNAAVHDGQDFIGLSFWEIKMGAIGQEPKDKLVCYRGGEGSAACPKDMEADERYLDSLPGSVFYSNAFEPRSSGLKGNDMLLECATYQKMKEKNDRIEQEPDVIDQYFEEEIKEVFKLFGSQKKSKWRELLREEMKDKKVKFCLSDSAEWYQQQSKSIKDKWIELLEGAELTTQHRKRLAKICEKLEKNERFFYVNPKRYRLFRYIFCQLLAAAEPNIAMVKAEMIETMEAALDGEWEKAFLSFFYSKQRRTNYQTDNKTEVTVESRGIKLNVMMMLGIPEEHREVYCECLRELLKWEKNVDVQELQELNQEKNVTISLVKDGLNEEALSIYKAVEEARHKTKNGNTITDIHIPEGRFWASNGELHLFFVLANLSRALEKYNSAGKSVIVMLDEIDLSFHPEWQRKILAILISFLNEEIEREIKIHTILTSHSPILLSDMPACNVVRLTETKQGLAQAWPAEAVQETFAQNIYGLFKNPICLTASIGEFAQSKIKDVLGVLQRLQNELQSMQNSAQKEKGKEAPVNFENREVWEKRFKWAEKQISGFGDKVMRKLLRERLRTMRSDWYRQDLTARNARIVALKKELDVLEELNKRPVDSE